MSLEESETIYQNALLADAAYILFEEGSHYSAYSGDTNGGLILEDARSDFRARGFTDQQFTDFQRQYRIVDHMPNESIGLSMTIFENRATNQRTIAFRGTEPTADYGADVIRDIALALGLSELTLGLGQSPVIDAFLKKNALLNADGSIASEYANSVNIVGHSLGGHLTLMAALDYPGLVNQVYTFNGAGITGLDSFYNLVLRPFFSDQAAAELDYLSNRTTNVYAEPGFEVTRSPLWFSYIGTPLPLFIEKQGGDASIDNHFMSFLVDALSVNRVLSLMGQELSLEQIDTMLWQATNREVEKVNSDTGLPDIADIRNAAISLNTIMNHLAEIIGGVEFGSLNTANDAALFYEKLVVAMESGMPFTLQPLSYFSDPVATAAVDPTEAGRALRYSLLEGLPFIVLPPAGYSEGVFADNSQNSAYEIDLYSAQFWNDRLDYYERLLVRNKNDLIDRPDGTVIGAGDNHYYDFLPAGVLDVNGQPQSAVHLLGSDATSLSDSNSRIIFGSNNGDNGSNKLEGGLAVSGDRIYGMGGDDELFGNKGRDWLEGGKGNDQLYGGADNDYLYGGEGSDTYYYVNGDGNDQINDVDGNDRLNINGDTITALTKIDADAEIYQDEQKNTYILGENGGLTIHVTDGESQTGSISIDQFNKDSNNFGITFEEPEEIVLPETTYVVGIDNVGATYSDRATSDQGYINDQGIQFDAPTATGVGSYDGVEEFEFEGGNLADNLTGGVYSDKLNGLSGDDYISGLAGTDFLEGGLGSDTMLGGEGDDMLSGNNMNKSPYGQSELYVKESELSRDFISGGAGDDHLNGDEGNDIVIGGAGIDMIAGGQGADIISGGSENDAIFGDSDRGLEGLGGNTLVTTETKYIETVDGVHTYDDVIDGGTGDDTILGEIGDDTISGGTGNDWIMGDRHNSAEDLLVDGVIVRNVTIDGVFYDWVIVDEVPDPTFIQLDSSLHGDDTLFGGDGNDVIAGNGGDDYIDGGADNDKLWGDDWGLEGADHGKDSLLGGAGDDQIIGGGNDDVLYGGDGQDILIGDVEDSEGTEEESPITLDGAYHGKDIIYGGNNNDTIIGGGNDDTLYGDSGNDVIYGDSSFSSGVLADIGGNEVPYSLGNDTYILDKAYHGNDVIDGGAGDDALYGGDGQDTISGGSGIDLIFGQEGNDTLDGGAGSDNLLGGSGDDTLIGGSGDDYLVGGTGTNTYVLNKGGGKDTVELTAGSQDIIQLGAGIDENDVLVIRQNNDFYLHLIDTSDHIHIENFFQMPLH